MIQGLGKHAPDFRHPSLHGLVNRWLSTCELSEDPTCERLMRVLAAVDVLDVHVPMEIAAQLILRALDRYTLTPHVVSYITYILVRLYDDSLDARLCDPLMRAF